MRVCRTCLLLFRHQTLCNSCPFLMLMNGSSASRRPGWSHGWSNKWKGMWEPYQYTWRAWSQPSNEDAEGEWKFVKKKSKKRKTEVKPQLSETPPLSPQDPHQTDQEMIDSDHKVKAHRTFLEAVLNDAPVPCLRTEQLEDQEKKAAHATRLEAMINMANTPEMAELHKSLSAELARVTKTVKSPPNSVRLEKKLAWNAREEKRLSELEASICKATEALTTRRATERKLPMPLNWNLCKTRRWTFRWNSVSSESLQQLRWLQVLFRHKETSKNILPDSLAVSLKCKQRSLQRSNGWPDSHIEIRLQNGLHLKGVQTLQTVRTSVHVE